VNRIPSLDGLRAISILLVILGHLASRHQIPWSFWSNYSNTGVRIFFVISGYLITQILLREQHKTSTIDLKAFYLRRAFRIFPAAFVFIGILGAVEWHQLHWYEVGAAVFYLSNFGFKPRWFFGHLWSLSVEEQFYLLWPGVLRSRRTWAVVILLGLIALAPCFIALLYHLHAPQEIFLTSPAVADSISIGCLLAIFANRMPKLPSVSPWIFLPIVVLVPLYPANTSVMLFLLRPIMNLAIAGLLLFAVQRPPWFLNVEPVCWVGRMSYSLYLWQQPFCFSPTIAVAYSPWLSLGCACASYYLVEQPMLRFRSHLQQRLAKPPQEIKVATELSEKLPVEITKPWNEESETSDFSM
jgi:peptidoglycan/LPS O-acetylase OafA/YrhL